MCTGYLPVLATFLFLVDVACLAVQIGHLAYSRAYSRTYYRAVVEPTVEPTVELTVELWSILLPGGSVFFSELAI